MDFSEREHDPIKKFTGLSLVVMIHVILVYALLTGLGKRIISVVKELPIEAKIIEEVQPPPPPPEAPPPPPKLEEPPPPFIPVPEVQVEQPVSPNAISAATSPQPTDSNDAGAASTPGPAIVSAQVDFNTCDKPAYPANSLRNEQSGVVRIRFLIGLDGRVADSKIEKSSGFKPLDSAAKTALSLCKFKPGTVDGKPQQLWTAVDYVWKLPK